jgi:hypothetical protein
MNMYEFAQPASILKFYDSRYLGKQSIVPAYPYIQTRLKLGPPLPDDNCSAIDELSRETLYPKPFGLAVSPVSGAPYTFFMRHT